MRDLVPVYGCSEICSSPYIYAEHVDYGNGLLLCHFVGHGINPHCCHQSDNDDARIFTCKYYTVGSNGGENQLLNASVSVTGFRVPGHQTGHKEHREQGSCGMLSLNIITVLQLPLVSPWIPKSGLRMVPLYSLDWLLEICPNLL